MTKRVVSSLRWIIALAMPIFLILSAARILINDWYPRSEYARRDFPRDVYGWTQQERLDLALPSIHFLNSPLPPDQAVALLAAQRQPASAKPLFTASELSHMVDVKRLTDALWRVHVATGILVVAGLGILLARPATRRAGYAAATVGGILTALFLLFIAFFVVTGFDTFFVIFHEIFFPQGNWTFNYSDSLIRLFPEKFWYDAGFLIAGGTLGAGVLITAAGWLLGRQSAAGSRNTPVLSGAEAAARQNRIG